MELWQSKAAEGHFDRTVIKHCDQWEYMAITWTLSLLILVLSKEARKTVCQDVILLPKNARKFLTVFFRFLEFQVNYVGRWSDVCPEVSSMRGWISYHYHFCWWNMTGYKCTGKGQVTDHCQCTICKQVEQIRKFTIQYLQPSILASAKLTDV